MQKILIILMAGLYLVSNLNSNPKKGSSQSGLITTAEPDSGSVVCPPGVYSSTSAGCLPMGPSEYLARIAASGIPDPILPLPLPEYSPPTALNDTPYLYLKVINQGVPLYATLQDAIAKNSYSLLDPGKELFVSYLGGPVKTDQGGMYYQLRSGVWIPADGSRFGLFYPQFQGLEFSSQPHNAFGWVLGTIHSRTAPGLNSPETGKSLYRFEVVQIYATQQASNITWDLINPDEWVDARQIAKVTPETIAPTGVTGNRWIEVNLFEQTLSVYDRNQLVFATMTSTGVNGFWTRPGLFQIYEKKPTETMSGSTEADRSDYYYLQDVPWTMYFDDKRALHGAYWHNNFGYPMSHGCVNLSIGDAHWLYDWANVNDFVYVYDPSGKTPVDPALYGAGLP
jgi:lipoprotein-anchoring transpeptidase ErfK/SrfK